MTGSVSGFGDRTIARCKQVGNPICLGLDPRLSLLPRGLSDDPVDAIRIFSERIVDIAADRVAAIKPQAAFFEAWRARGFEVFESVCRRARDRGLIVIADVKRGDIGSTAAAYAEAYLTPTADDAPLADAVTVNAYLGSDGVRPFIDAGSAHGRGVFVLVKTSNPSSGELQDRKLDDGRAVCEHMAGLVTEWNTPRGETGYGPVGAVVGATYPDHLAMLRNQLPGSIILLPGYGAQGAGAADVVTAFDENGVGALVSASRSLTFPWTGEGSAPVDWERRIVQAIDAMNDELASVLPSGS